MFVDHEPKSLVLFLSFYISFASDHQVSLLNTLQLATRNVLCEQPAIYKQLALSGSCQIGAVSKTAKLKQHATFMYLTNIDNIPFDCLICCESKIYAIYLFIIGVLITDHVHFPCTDNPHALSTVYLICVCTTRVKISL